MDFKNILKFVEQNKKEYLSKELAENKKLKADTTKRKASVQMVTISGSRGR